MSELVASFDVETAEQEHVTAASSDTTVLITEQEVLFATAAAVPFAKTVHNKKIRPRRRHYPPRNDFLEDSRMAREMWRL
jgi:hypothetical protein